MAARKKRSRGHPWQAVKLETVLGQVIARLRVRLGLAQGELAELLGVSAGTASRLEAGQVVSLDQLWHVARALNVSASGLLLQVEEAVHALESNGVSVVTRRALEPPDQDAQLLKGAALAGLLGFLLARGGK